MRVLLRQAYASQSIFPDQTHISSAPGSEAQLGAHLLTNLGFLPGNADPLRRIHTTAIFTCHCARDSSKARPGLIA